MEKIQENKKNLIESLLADRFGSGGVSPSLIVDCCGGGDCGCGSVKDGRED